MSLEVSHRRRINVKQRDKEMPRARSKSVCVSTSELSRIKPNERCSSSFDSRCCESRELFQCCLPIDNGFPRTDEFIYSDKNGLNKYKRSLKLVGLQLGDFSLGAYDSTSKPDIRNVKPKVNSVIKRRSVSVEDLHEAIIRVGFPLNQTAGREASVKDKYRQVLAKAIYEEWYFKKKEECVKRRAEESRQQKVLQWEHQNRRCEQLRMAQLSYSDWLLKKGNKQQHRLGSQNYKCLEYAEKEMTKISKTKEKI